MSDDLERMMAVMAAAFDPAYGEAWTLRQVSDALVMPGMHYLLIAGDGRQATPEDAAAGFAFSRAVLDEEELLLLAVHPDHRGRGLGGKLLARFVDDARRRGSSRVFLEMREGNSAERLYLSHGFHRVGRRPDYYRRGSHGPCDAITFALSLP